MENQIIILDGLEAIIELVTKDLTNDHTRRAYKRMTVDFLRWWQSRGKPPFCKDVVIEYRMELMKRGLSIASINLCINVIHRLARESLDAGLMSAVTANGILRVKGLKHAGRRSGNWLTLEQAEAMINAPEAITPMGIRDKAILACLIGAGLRRSELVNLTVENIQQREGRWCFVDILGKGNRVRTVPIPGWVKESIDVWLSTGRVHAGNVFYSLDRSHARKPHTAMTGQAIYTAVRYYAKVLGIKAQPHDLRRTFAKLSYKGGSDLVQIQSSLGHSSPETTLRYLGDCQNIQDAPADHLGLFK